MNSERFWTTTCPLENTELSQCDSVTVFIERLIDPSVCHTKKGQVTIMIMLKYRFEWYHEVTWMSDGPIIL